LPLALKDINSTVKAIVDEYVRYTVEEIRVISGLSSSYEVFHLEEKLKLSKMCTRWIPPLLNSDQKCERVEKSLGLID
jgi:hypothetical protein